MRTETFSRFMLLSLLVHAGVWAALYLGGWLDPDSSKRFTSTGFDLARVHGALERMRSAEPVSAAPAVADTAPAVVEPEPETDVLGLGAKPHRRRATSLAPSNLMEILDGGKESPVDAFEEPEDKEKGRSREPTDLDRALRDSGGAPSLTGSPENTEVLRQKASTGKGLVKSGGFAIGGKGEVSRQDIEAILEKRLPQIQNCYQTALLETSGISGKLLLRWSISKSGEVEQVLIEKSQLENAELHSCIVQEIAKTEFPKPEGGSVILRLPLTFSVQE